MGIHIPVPTPPLPSICSEQAAALTVRQLVQVRRVHPWSTPSAVLPEIGLSAMRRSGLRSADSTLSDKARDGFVVDKSDNQGTGEYVLDGQLNRYGREHKRC